MSEENLIQTDPISNVPASGRGGFHHPRYECLEPIGTGGTGVVYEAHDRERGHRVALKWLNTSCSSAISRLKQEFRSVAALHHDNLITLYDLVVEHGVCFYTMEYVDGVDFAHYVRGSTSSPLHVTLADRQSTTRGQERLETILPQLVDAIAYLHASGKIHRDLKPANVLVERTGRVVVLDFSLVHDRSPWDPKGTTHGAVRGTPAYMAPEQARGEQCTEASDWYALGVMLYECLLGQLPFSGTAFEIIAAKQSGFPPDVEPLGAHGSLGEICAALLCADREERMRAAQELVRGWSRTNPAFSSSIFVGRDHELALLQDAYERSTSEPMVILLHGAPGIGKTALMRRFLGQIHHEATVFAARCYEYESVPYRGLDGLIDKLADYIHQLDDEGLETMGGGPELACLFEALERFGEDTPKERGHLGDVVRVRKHAIEQLKAVLKATAQPSGKLVLAIDDVQWADADSGRLLRDVLSGTDAPPLLLVMTCRNDERQHSRFLDALLRSVPGERRLVSYVEVELPPLAVQQSRVLANRLIRLWGSDCRVTPEKIAEESRGCPMFVHELVRCPRANEHGSPLSLNAAIQARAAELPISAQQLLRVVSVAGHPLHETVATAAADLSEDSSKVVAVLQSAQFIKLRSNDEGIRELEPYHPSIRSAILTMTSKAERRRCHAAIALASAHVRGAPPELFATHWRQAGDCQRAAVHAETAAREAANVLAFEQAAKLYRIALDSTFEPTRRDRLLLDLAQTLANTGRSAEAATLYLQAANSAVDARAVRLRVRAAANLLVSGHFAEGMQVLEQVFTALGLRYPKVNILRDCSISLMLARFRWRGTEFEPRHEHEVALRKILQIDVMHAATSGFSLTNPPVAFYFVLRGLREAFIAGEPQRVAWSLLDAAAGISALGPKQFGRAEQMIQQAEQIEAEMAGSSLLPALIAQARGIALACGGHFAGALEPLRASEQVFRKQSQDLMYYIGPGQWMESFCLLLQGRLTDLQETCARRLREATSREDRRGEVYARIFMAFSAARCGRLDEARIELERALRRWSFPEFTLERLLVLVGHSEIDLYMGRVEQAHERIEHLWELGLRFRILDVYVLRLLVLQTRARIAVARGRGARAKIRRLKREPGPWPRAVANSLQATLDLEKGRRAKAAARLLEASMAFESAAMSVDAAFTKLLYAKACHGNNGRLLEESRRTLHRLGVHQPDRWVAVQVPRFMELLGALPGPSDPTAIPAACSKLDV